MSAEATIDSAIDRQTQTERIAILFRHAPPALFANVLLSSIFVALLWNVIPESTLLLWSAAVACVIAVRVALLMAYKRRGHDASVRWDRWMTGAIALSGLVWGAAGWWFFAPDSPLALILVTTGLTSMAIAAIPTHASWPPAQVAFAVPTLLPLSFRYLIDGDNLWIMGVLFLITLIQVLLNSRNLSRTLLESLRLRHEKQALARQLEEEKRVAEAAHAEAAEASAEKTRFLAAVSHDLRQPSFAINMFIEALRQGKDPGVAERIVAHLGASARALEELLDELLDMSRLEAGLLVPRPRIVAVQELFDDLMREWGPVAAQNGVDLGFVPTRLRVVSDPQMLGRILRNLVANAIRYSDGGGVLIGCRRHGDDAAIAVCDAGPGIAPEDQQAIFREFVQLGNPERDRHKGLGLGLSIAAGLCRVLDHRLELHSRVGHGSTFSVVVPRALDEAPRSAPAPVEPFAHMGGWPVLVIDDEASVRMAMAEVLTGWGCRVITAESGDEAIAELNAAAVTPGAIIADYRLRDGRTGPEAIDAVRRHFDRAIPAFLITGDTAPERLREAMACGLPLLHKPVQPARVRAVLTRLRQAGTVDASA